MIYRKRKGNNPFLPVLVMAAFGVLFLCSPSAIFAAEDPIDKLKELENKAEKYTNIIELEQKEQSVLQTQISSLDAQATKVESDIEKNQEELKNTEEEIVSVRNSITEKEEFLKTQKVLLSQLLQSHYERSRGKEIGIYLLVDTARGFLAKDDQFAQTGEKIKEVVETTTALRDELIDNKEVLEAKKLRIADLNYELEQRTSYLENTKTQKQVLVAKSENQESIYQKKLTKVQQEQLDVQREISGIELGKIGNFNLSDLPSRDKANFGYPVKSPRRVTQGYGITSFSYSYASGVHNGIDYGLNGSSAILAVADGKIKATGNMGKYGYGKWIAIDHGNGLVTLYGHLSSVKVSSGSVDKGDTIGTMGSTGFSTGTHVHFTVFAESTFAVVNSKKVSGVRIPVGGTVNPLRYL